MKRNLYSLLRIRDLVEELSRLDLERKAVALRAAEEAGARQQRLVRTVRSAALRLLAEAAPESTSAWLTEVADAELLNWKKTRLLAIAEARRPAFEIARDVLLARRLDRLQVKTLAAAAAKTEEAERARREQRNIDDWFRSRAARAVRTPRETRSTGRIPAKPQR